MPRWRFKRSPAKMTYVLPRPGEPRYAVNLDPNVSVDFVKVYYCLNPWAEEEIRYRTTYNYPLAGEIWLEASRSDRLLIRFGDLRLSLWYSTEPITEEMILRHSPDVP